jgi:hypothetical protein
MGTVPATGTEVSMGRIGIVLGLYATTGSAANVGLNGVLGTGRNRSYSGLASIPSGSQTPESSTFGGVSGSGTY